ncbi:hypothetical protein GGR57DRAFT_451851 [Xylariaceae sp. FL1272]|nr:hypothetical protein GGR57DRAFT_451851 [Xylariaceae sp. FL1272]
MIFRSSGVAVTATIFYVCAVRKPPRKAVECPKAISPPYLVGHILKRAQGNPVPMQRHAPRFQSLRESRRHTSRTHVNMCLDVNHPTVFCTHSNNLTIGGVLKRLLGDLITRIRQWDYRLEDVRLSLFEIDNHLAAIVSVRPSNLQIICFANCERSKPLLHYARSSFRRNATR